MVSATVSPTFTSQIVAVPGTLNPRMSIHTVPNRIHCLKLAPKQFSVLFNSYRNHPNKRPLYQRSRDLKLISRNWPINITGVCNWPIDIISIVLWLTNIISSVIDQFFSIAIDQLLRTWFQPWHAVNDVSDGTHGWLIWYRWIGGAGHIAVKCSCR